jgi:hypothetical protein
MEYEQKALQIIIFMLIVLLGAIMIYDHDKHSERLEELKQLQLEKIEKEKYIIGYWVMNSRTCQYEYEVKI